MLAVLRIAGPRLLDGEQRERLCILANLVEAREAEAPVPILRRGTVVLN